MSGWQQAFDVINTALGVIKTAGNTPGINLIPYVSTVASAASALQAGLNAAVNIAPYVVAISKTFKDGLPTDAERAALNAKIAELEAIVDAPLPPKEDGEED
jgi:hypothetical protein